MKFESPFNKIKKPLIVGALTIASFLPQDTEAQTGGVVKAPEVKIENSEGVQLEKHLKEIKDKKLKEVSDYIISLQKEIAFLSDESNYKKSVEAGILKQKSMALDQVSLIDKVSTEVSGIRFYQNKIHSFISEYIIPNKNPEVEQDTKLRGIYDNLYSLIDGHKKFGYTRFDFWLELQSLAIKDFANEEDFKKEFQDVLISYKEALNGQFIEPFNTTEKMQNYLENRWVFRPKESSKLEEISYYQKVKDFLKKEQNLGLLKSKVIDIYKLIYRHITSEEYLNKLKIEFGGEINAKEQQADRIKRFEEVSIEFEADTIDFSSYYADLNKIVFNLHNLIQDFSFGSTIHEPSHLLDKAGIELSDKAIDLYKKGWIGDEQFLKLREEHPILFKRKTEKDDLAYFKTLTELSAHKKVLDFYMEQNGIKKYQEPMNEKHYEKLTELFKKGELDLDCSQILLLIKKEFLIEILNTVAYEPQGGDVLYLV